MSDSAFSLLNKQMQQAIWSMQWRELRPVQVQAIQEIYGGERHLLVTAATAGGKTEAAFLPILSKISEQPKDSVQALYVGPLKALINDQFARLELLCEKLDIPVHRWHGDVSGARKKQLRDRPGGILLITPESLESNFINFARKIPALYRHLEFVVIDELHSFMGNVRGTHLQSLLSRLRLASSAEPRVIGLSATLGDPDAAKTFIDLDAPGSVTHITDSDSQREIRYQIKTYVRSPSAKTPVQYRRRLTPAQIAKYLSASELTPGSHAALDDHGFPIEETNEASNEIDEIAEDIMQYAMGSSNLVFVNSRSNIEELAVQLRDKVKRKGLQYDPFVVHHGSLSKAIREDAEASLKDELPTTAICSSTLEMGIDIGNVKAVVQVDPPWSVSSLVQRLGRSGRRDDEPSIMRIYVRVESPNPRTPLSELLCPDLLRSLALTRLMLEKWLEPLGLSDLNLSTLVHQTMSCLKQTGGLPATTLFQVLCQRGPFRQVSSSQYADLLRSLAEHDIIEQVPGGQLILGLKGERITRDAEFYAAFASTAEYVVRNSQSEIGRLPANRIPRVGENLILAGRKWRLEEIDHTSQRLYVVPSTGGVVPSFESSDCDVHDRIAATMRAVLLDDDEPPYLDAPGKTLLRSARQTAQRLELDRSDAFRNGSDVVWFPWVGAKGFRTLQLYGKALGVKCESDPTGLAINVNKVNMDQFHHFLREIQDSSLLPGELAQSLTAKCFSKFDEFLPESLLDFANGRDRLDLDQAKKICQRTLASLKTQ